MKRKLFIEGKNYNTQAYFGWQNTLSALWGIKEGYKNTADLLVENIIEGQENNIEILDTYVFPICFLYRHSIEIFLKIIYMKYYKKVLPGNHDLVKLWDRLYNEVIINLENLSSNIKDVKEIRSMLEEFNKFKDEKGDVFRYLVNKNGELYFEQSIFIDYTNLKDNINYIHEILELIYIGVDLYLNYITDMQR